MQAKPRTEFDNGYAAERFPSAGATTPRWDLLFRDPDNRVLGLYQNIAPEELDERIARLEVMALIHAESGHL